MEGTKRQVMFFVLWIIPLFLYADNKTEIYRAYINGNMQEWRTTIDRMHSSGHSATDGLAELANYQYGYIGWCLGTGRNDEARKYLDIAERNLELLRKEQAYLPLVLAYESAFCGYRISLNRMLAPVLGRKSYQSAREALRLDGKNPMANIQYGNILFYVPKMFGGSKEEALKYFLKAQKLMEENPASLAGDWNYLNLLTLIARTYTYVDDYEKSLQYLEKALRIEPDFKWVRDELYPETIKKMKK